MMASVRLQRHRYEFWPGNNGQRLGNPGSVPGLICISQKGLHHLPAIQVIHCVKNSNFLCHVITKGKNEPATTL